LHVEVVNLLLPIENFFFCVLGYEMLISFFWGDE